MGRMKDHAMQKEQPLDETRYIVIETVENNELLSVRLYTTEKRARNVFTICAKENRAHIETDLRNEVYGTIAFAGDDCYAVQVLAVREVGD